MIAAHRLKMPMLIFGTAGLALESRVLNGNAGVGLELPMFNWNCRLWPDVAGADLISAVIGSQNMYNLKYKCRFLNLPIS